MERLFNVYNVNKILFDDLDKVEKIDRFIQGHSKKSGTADKARKCRFVSVEGDILVFHTDQGDIRVPLSEKIVSCDIRIMYK